MFIVGHGWTPPPLPQSVRSLWIPHTYVAEMFTLATAMHLNVSILVTIESHRGAYFDKIVSQHLSGAGSSPAGSINWDLNSQQLHY